MLLFLSFEKLCITQVLAAKITNRYFQPIFSCFNPYKPRVLFVGHLQTKCGVLSGSSLIAYTL